MDFEKGLEEQVDAQHRHIIDEAPEATIIVNGESRKVKCVLVGEDEIPTYWDTETHEEVFPDHP